MKASGCFCSWDILGKGIRSVPLVTAMVVVFVTSDAWRILGTGFTPRFFMLVSTFLLASLLFLIRKDWWADFNVDKDEVTSLLQGINTGIRSILTSSYAGEPSQFRWTGPAGYAESMLT